MKRRRNITGNNVIALNLNNGYYKSEVIMDTQTNREYLTSLEKQIEQMEPLERVCSHVVLVLGRCIAELLNTHQHAPIAEMERVIGDIFKQARIARDQASGTVQ